MLRMLQRLFEMAVQKSMLPGMGGHHQWYPYSYMFGHLMRRAEFVVKEAAQLLGEMSAAVVKADSHTSSYSHTLQEREVSNMLTCFTTL